MAKCVINSQWLRYSAVNGQSPKNQCSQPGEEHSSLVEAVGQLDYQKEQLEQDQAVAQNVVDAITLPLPQPEALVQPEDTVDNDLSNFSEDKVSYMYIGDFDVRDDEPGFEMELYNGEVIRKPITVQRPALLSKAFGKTKEQDT